MRHRALSVFLLGTFVFWATGLARYAHERIEHHGHDQSAEVDDDDDDDAPPAPVNPTDAAHHVPAAPHSRHPCPVCQMLAAMTVDRSSPPALPQRPAGCVAVLQLLDRIAPYLAASFTLPARGPPAHA